MHKDIYKKLFFFIIKMQIRQASQFEINRLLSPGLMN